MLFKKRSTFGENDIRLEVPVPDFIPYACHYDANTLLTKNGELLQVIKVTGFSYEAIGAVKVGLRETVRKAILENIAANNIALWFHTMRRRTNLDPGGKYPKDFSHYLNSTWAARHDWKNQYVNELYISVVYEGVSTRIRTPKEFFRSLSFKAQREYHDQYLEQAHYELNKTVEKMLQTLQHFGAQRLTVISKDGGYYSEQLQFLSKVINQAEMPMPMPIIDLSHYLANHKIAFGNNAFEIKGPGGKRFGTIFTIKEYHELSTRAIDQLLQLPQRFVITQSIDFVNTKQALEPFKHQKYIMDVSGNTEMGEISGVKEIMTADTGSSVDYGQHQLTITLLANDLEALGQDIETAVFELFRLGIVAVREDLHLEQCFWSQLPANFSFLCRQSYINTARVGGFASLHNFPAGKRAGNHWGSAVTVFHTAAGTPYFFNFHSSDNGHTLIIGPFGAGKTVLMNFLVSEARKFGSKLFFFDQMRASKVFIKSINGKYGVLYPSKPEFSFNPFMLSNTEKNRAFLCKWFYYLTGLTVSDQERTVIAQLVTSLYQLTIEERTLTKAAHILLEAGEARLAESLAPWYGEGVYARLFDNKQDIFNEAGLIYGFGMSYVLQEPPVLGPVLSYLFHRVELALDGNPVMVVLDEAWRLVDNTMFAPELAHWLDRLRARNAIVIFATESVDDASRSQITRALVEKVATQIYLPNSHATDAYKKIFGMTEEEFELLRSIDARKRQFLLKSGNETIVASLDLTGMEELAVLAGSDETVTIMEQVIAETGSEPDAWLPKFYNRIN